MTLNPPNNKMTTTEKQSAGQETNDPWVDDMFRLEHNRWGTWSSFDKMENKLVISLTEELCIEATRFYLKGKQDGFPSEGASYSGTVGGKL